MLSAIYKGLSVDEATGIFGAGRSTIFGWLKLRDESGVTALEVKTPPGRKPVLTQRQLAQLRGWIIGQDPRRLQFEFALRKGIERAAARLQQAPELVQAFFATETCSTSPHEETLQSSNLVSS